MASNLQQVWWWVLIGAALHAAWNALVKSGQRRHVVLAFMRLNAALLSLPLLIAWGWPSAAAWPYLLASASIHFLYYRLLALAYEQGDLVVVYPLMRGLAPLVVSGLAWGVLGERLHAVAWLGVALISLGVLSLGALAWRQVGGRASGVGVAVLNAMVIAAYTLVDAQGVRVNGDPWSYVLAQALVDAPPFLLWVWWRERRSVDSWWQMWRSECWVGLGAAVASLLSYGVALWAMTRAPVAVVAALRETSMLFALLLGAWRWRESLSWARIAAVVLISAGVAGMRMA